MEWFWWVFWWMAVDRQGLVEVIDVLKKWFFKMRSRLLNAE